MSFSAKESQRYHEFLQQYVGGQMHVTMLNNQPFHANIESIAFTVMELDARLRWNSPDGKEHHWFQNGKFHFVCRSDCGAAFSLEANTLLCFESIEGVYLTFTPPSGRELDQQELNELVLNEAVSS